MSREDAREEIRHGSGPRLPRRLYLVNAAAPSLHGAMEHLLGDFEEALRVYERHAHHARPADDPDAEDSLYGPEGLPMERLRWDGGTGASASGGAGADGTAAACMPPDSPAAATSGPGNCPAPAAGNPEGGHEPGDTVPVGDPLAGHPESLLIGCSCDAGRPSFTGDGLPGRPSSAPGSSLCVYVLALTGAPGAGEAYPACELIEAVCREDPGLVWRGGLAIGGGAAVLPQAGTARMGGKRRARSEAIDLLIAAVRAGWSLGEAAGCPEDVLAVDCPLPRFFYERRYRSS